MQAHTRLGRSSSNKAGPKPDKGRTDIFIRPGHEWREVDLLLTNFHQPRSSLLVLLEAFCGPGWRRLYDLALAEGYRFLSFGDAMLVARRAGR